MNELDWARMEYLRNRIQDRQLLRDAQIPSGTDHQSFQNEITGLTNELRGWEQNIDQLSQLEDDMAAITRRTSAAEQNSWQAARDWLAVAIVCGLIGAPLLVLSFLWSPSPALPWVSAALLVLAGIAVFMSMTKRSLADDVRTQTAAELNRMLTERNRLIPRSYGPTKLFPRFSHEVIVRDTKNPHAARSTPRSFGERL